MISLCRSIRFANPTSLLLLLSLALPALTQAQVNVTVNAAQTVRAVDERVFGANSVIWDGEGDTDQTISLLQAAGLRTVRIPGGSLSDEYHWRTNKARDYTWSWSTGLDGFTKIITGLNGQAFVTVNYGSGTPEEAAAWVAYANAPTGSSVNIGTDAKGYNWQTAGTWASLRAAAPLGGNADMDFLRASRASPYGLKYWEIGNECYGTWEYDLQSVPHDPTTYANRVGEYIAKMKAVDPTIKVGVVVVTSGENASYNNWTPVMLARLKVLGVTPDFVIYHRYPQGPGNESDATLLQDAGTWAATAANIRQQLTTYLGATGAGVEIVVTENNSVYTNPGKQSTSLVNGLYLADSIASVMKTEINAFMWWDVRNGSPEDPNTHAIIGNMSNSLYGWRSYGDYGMISTPHAGGAAGYYEPYPTYYAMKLLKYFVRGGDTVVAATSSSNLLSIFSARRADGTLSLLVINKDPVNTLNANIALSGFTPGATATVYSYGKPQDTAGGSADIVTSSMSIAGATFSASFASYSMTVLSISNTIPPAITLHPVDQTVTAGNSVTFTAAASGTPAPTYQWQKNSVNIAGATNSSYTIASPVAADAGSYRVIATNTAGSATSNAATLTVNAAPLITLQPASQTVIVAASVTFTAAASGTPAPTYQWRKDNVDVSGATSSSYTIASAVLSDAGSYTVVATNSAGSVTSNAAVLTVNSVPAITLQPASQTVVAGNSVTFTATASGVPAPTYQWQKDGVNISGATNSAYTIAITAGSDAGSYIVIAINAAGMATSNAAELVVNVPPEITLQPLSQGVTVGHLVSFTAAASGIPAPTYQWQKNGVNIPGATVSSYTIATTIVGDAGSYVVVATNLVGSATSATAVLAVNIPPGITLQPVGQTVTAGNPVTFTAAASGSPAPTYQWQKNYVNIAGATGNSYTIDSPVGSDAGGYTVVASNVAGAATSNPAVLVVNVPPAFTTQPIGHYVTVGANVTLTVVATGFPAPTYQWKKAGVDIPGATLASYSIINAQPADGAVYTVVATNLVGSATSNATPLTVTTASLAPVLNDFTNDGNPDILWRNNVTGAFALWLMNGTVRQSAFIIGAAPLDWEVAGTGDFNADGQTDLLWRNPTTGTVAYWLMNGTALQSIVVTTNVPTDWTISGTGDFNNDGKVDILWRNPATGTVAYWLMNGTVPQSVVVTTNVPTDWTISGTGDFNNDGKVDILWRKPTTGDVAYWLMNGTSQQSVVVTANVPTAWTIAGTGDYNADGQVDILWQNYSTGGVAFWLMNGTAMQSVITIGNIPTGWLICN